MLNISKVQVCETKFGVGSPHSLFSCGLAICIIISKLSYEKGFSIEEIKIRYATISFIFGTTEKVKQV